MGKKNCPYIFFVKNAVFRIWTRKPRYFKHRESKYVSVLQPKVSDRNGITELQSVRGEFFDFIKLVRT